MKPGGKRGFWSQQFTDADYMARWKARCNMLPNGCWEWTGWKALGKCMYDRARGYPEASYRGKLTRLTRLIAGWNIGRPLTDEEVACHSCDFPPCINPAHLWVGTTRDNVLDRMRKGRDHHSSLTHCPRGHSYAEHGVRHGKNQFRGCSVCQRARFRIKAGWPSDLAYALPVVPHGKRVVNGKFPRKSD